MKILHTVESYLPLRHGMQEVVTQLSEFLIQKGHEVTIATSYHEKRFSKIINCVKIEEFNISGNFVNGMNGDTQSYQQFLLDSDFDIITNFAAQQWATDLALPILPQLKAKKIFVPTGFSGFYNELYAQYFENMQNWIKDYDSCVFLSEDYRDINFAKKFNAKNILVIPNGADKSEFDSNTIAKNELFAKLNIPQDSFVILTVGSHTGMKGHNESIEIFKKLKIKNAILCIVGNHQKITIKYYIKTFLKFLLVPIKKFHFDCFFSCRLKTFKFNILNRSKKIQNLNLTRKETVALYLASDLFLFPSNIECSPIVLFECGAAKLPFLTSDVGNSREIIKWTKGGQLLKTKIDNQGYSSVDINDACEKIYDLYNKPEERKKIGENGYLHHVSSYNWEVISNKYEQLYLSLLS